MASSWVRGVTEKARRLTSEANTALQPRLSQAKRSLEDGFSQMGLKTPREVYADDPQLAAAMRDLDSTRALIKTIANAVDAHRRNLLALAQGHKVLGDVMAAPTGSLVELVEKCVGNERLEAQVSLGTAELAVGNSLARHAMDMSTPIIDLNRTFEEEITSKIAPLRKKYMTEKGEYLSYVRKAQATDDLTKRTSLETMAQSAMPVWQATSATLAAEVQTLVSHVTTNMSEWVLNFSQAQEEVFGRGAKAFAAPARQAEALQGFAPPTE